MRWWRAAIFGVAIVATVLFAVSVWALQFGIWSGWVYLTMGLVIVEWTLALGGEWR